MATCQDTENEIVRFLNEKEGILPEVKRLTEYFKDKPDTAIHEIVKLPTRDKYNFTEKDFKSTIERHLGHSKGLSPGNNYYNGAILKAMEYMDKVFLSNI